MRVLFKYRETGGVKWLDNLSLGYGGTKSEMERLLADAQKLTGVKYDISNLKDVYSAIHVIQTELGVTGTTSLEAASTVSGSLASMKGAAMNLLAVIASGGDVSQAFNSLFDTVLTFAGNLVPMVGRILSGLPDLLTGVIDSLVALLNEGVSNSDAVLSFAVNLIGGIANSLIVGLPALISSMVNLLVELGKSIVAYDWASVITELVGNVKAAIADLSQIFVTDNDIVKNISDGIFGSIPMVLSAIGDVMVNLINFIGAKGPDILQKGYEIIQKLAKGLMDNLPEITKSMGQLFQKLFKAIMDNGPTLLKKGGEIVVKLATGLIKSLPTIVRALFELLGSMAKTVMDYDWLSLGKDIVRGIISGLKSMGSALWDAMKSLASDAFGAVKDFFEIGSPSKLMADEIGHWLPPGIAEGAEANLKPLNSAMSDIANSSVNTLSADFGKMPSRLSAPVTASSNEDAILELMGKYLPVIADKCGTTLSTDAKKIFNVVKTEAKEYRDVTGREAFA